jgi:hypothetical protein
MEDQINGFRGFKTQRDNIQGFEKRMLDSKTKAETLSERLEKARSRVQKLEETEGEWQAAVSRMCTLCFQSLSNDILMAIP